MSICIQRDTTAIVLFHLFNTSEGFQKCQMKNESSVSSLDERVDGSGEGQTLRRGEKDGQAGYQLHQTVNVGL